MSAHAENGRPIGSKGRAEAVHYLHPLTVRPGVTVKGIVCGHPIAPSLLSLSYTEDVRAVTCAACRMCPQFAVARKAKP